MTIAATPRSGKMGRTFAALWAHYRERARERLENQGERGFIFRIELGGNVRSNADEINAIAVEMWNRDVEHRR
jgi:hypothetical protein